MMTNISRTPTIDKMIELPSPDDPQISPDGSCVAYTLTTPDWEQDKFISQIWLVADDGTESRRLTFGVDKENKPTSTWSPRWSPDGKWLAFLSQRAGDEHTQIYRMSLRGGEAERLTNAESDISAFEWSPDGKSIAYCAVDPENAADKERKEKYGDYKVEDEDYSRTHLWLFDLADKKSRRLTSGDDLDVADVRWHPGGDRIAFRSCPSPDAKDWERSRVYVVSLKNLELSALTGENCGSPRWSPDGAELAFTYGGATYYHNGEIRIMSAAGGDARTVSQRFDGNPWLQEWGPDGLYFTSLQGTSAHLFRLDPASGAYTQLTPTEPAGWASLGCSFSADFTRSALCSIDAQRIDEVSLLTTRDGTVRHLTQYTSELKEWRLAPREVIRWVSADGTEIEGVLTKPTGFDPTQKYPLLVVIHGGPSWVSLLAQPWHGRRLYPMQQWVDKGALILEPNYRGSEGYGEAFRTLNVRNLGVGDYEDVISGVDALIARGWVDEGRVGAMGWSQGGYISAFITTYSDRFKAVSAGAGISNWVTYYVNTDIHPFTRHYLQATPWDDMEVYQKTSPMTYIKNARTPTLIQHGEKDARVPVPNAFELYQGLVDMGVEARLVTYPGMGHGPSTPRRMRQIMQDNLDWFNRWIWGEEPAAKEPPPCYVAIASGDQRQDAGHLAVIDRYTAPHIHDVYQWARRDRAEFRIFVGGLGLLRAEDSVSPDAPTLQLADVSAVAERIVAQIKNAGLKKIVLHTAKTKEEPAVLTYLGCLQVAAGATGEVSIEHKEVAEKEWQLSNGDD